MIVFAIAAMAASELGIAGCGSSSLKQTDDGGSNVTTDDGGNLDASQDSPSDQGASLATGPSDAGPDAPQLPPCGMPTFVPNGGSIGAGSTVSILPPAGLPMSSSVIFYTTDGTLPTHASPMYSGPIQLNVAETIKAMAFAQGICTDSPVATAVFAVTVADAGTGTSPVSFAPPAATLFNDFTVTLSAGAGTTICYTLDGTTVPACTAAGGCMAGSTPYNPSSQIGITGAITNATTGLVAVKAIACAAGVQASPAVSQTYGLKAAAPAFQSPSAPSVVPYPGASPTVSTTTAATGTSVPSLHYTTDGTTPTCTTGTEVNGTAGGASGTVPLTTTTSFKVVACKTGYATSDVTTGAYSVQLNAPVFANGTGTYYDDVSPGLSVGPSGQNPAAAWVCYSTSGTARCAPTPRACGAGSAAESVAASAIVKTGTVLNAVTCTPDATKYSQSPEMSAQTYTLQLGPIAFSPNGGSVGTAGTLGTIKILNSKGDDSTNPSAKDYAFICWTNDDGAPEPDCVCAHPTPAASLMGVHKSAPTTRSEFDNAVATAPNNLRIRAVGCDGATPPNSNYLPSNTPAARVHFNSTAQLQSPDIAPVEGTYNNDQDIVLSNSSAVAAVLCYSTNGIDPSTSTTSCTAGGVNGGATTCLPAVSAAGGGSASATINGLVNTTGLDVRALACDPARVLANSPVAANTYTLQVAKPTVSPANGTVSVGQTVVFATATASTSASAVTFYYTIDGSAPACGTGPLHIPGNTGTPSTANYAVTGLEVGGIRVVGCRANYAQSNVSNTTSYAIVAERPVLSYASGTYDDYLSPAIQATSTNNGSYWICFTTDPSGRPACATTNDHCAAAGGTAIARAQLSAANCTGLPNGSTALSGRCGVPPAIILTNTTLQAVSCSKPGATVFESPAVAAATYVLNVSDVNFSPVGGMQTATIPTVAAALVPSTTAPAGNPVAPGTDGVTGGATICVAQGASQPATSACVTDLNWKCGAGPQQTAGSNVATTTTFYAFACKTGMATTPVRKVDYTFSAAPYVHTGFVMTGHPGDFTGAESIARTTAFVTWDNTFLYVGFDVQLNLTGGSGPAWIHYYIAGVSGGTATADSTAQMPTPDTALPPAHSQFHVFLALSGTGIAQAESGVNSWDGSAWVAEPAVTLTAVHTTGNFYEIKIPLVAGHLDLGTMSEFHLAGEGYDATKKAFGAWPASNVAGNLSTQWQIENLMSPGNPNAITN